MTTLEERARDLFAELYDVKWVTMPLDKRRDEARALIEARMSALLNDVAEEVQGLKDEEEHRGTRYQKQGRAALQHAAAMLAAAYGEVLCVLQRHGAG